ncbi:hypothetical protein J520_0310 [Acinetobacter sp. 869535]|uniref:hypothetical protein n=1 Tax=Acinetobacter sp. 869535 TaxID=1310621 RepID=UPI00044C857F|nr:hypothetical protein [Acinetobacter sp. 869535]EXC34418.1 hypothetical protein J520_0310 [Acinetobacter sp. 869535]
MNLIEQLGGYEAAKAGSEARHRSGIAPCELDRQLLEYRRQHKIYEVGDLVVKCGSIHQKSTSFSLWQVLLVLQTSIPCIEVAPLSKKGKVIHAGKSIQVLQQFRHAEPEELKAGKRLEVV